MPNVQLLLSLQMMDIGGKCAKKSMSKAGEKGKSKKKPGEKIEDSIIDSMA
ncbi:hypothetical protein H1R20_g15759, partial [Candolleomyces eurysporus]